MNLPTPKEWEDFGFKVPDELCSKANESELTALKFKHMSDTGTISQELINKVAEELATLRREREELRKALSDLMLVAEHIDISQGLTMGQLFPKRFEAARAVLAKGKA